MNHLLIIGPGDIGIALAEYALLQGSVVSLAGRHSFSWPAIRKFFTLSMEDESSYQILSEYIAEQSINIVVDTRGILHDDGHFPEKSIQEFDVEWFLTNIKVNCVMTARLLKHLTNTLSPSHPLKFIALSARLGSITDNRKGGWISYRTSKAALNMVLKTVAIEWQHRLPNAVLVGYHPGTVDTKLSKPYSKILQKVFTTKEAADYLGQFIDSLKTEMSGTIFDWQQKPIPY